MKIVLYVLVLSSIVGLAQPILLLPLAKMLFDQVFGIMMFLGINTAIDSVWAQIFPTEDPIMTLRTKVMERFDGLTSHIQQAATITVQELNNYIEESQLLVPKIQQIDELLKKLNSEEEYIKKLRNQEGSFEKDTLRSFADGIISNHRESVTSRMAAIFNMVIGTPSSSGHNFIDLFMQSLERTKYHKVCHLQTSPQQAFLELFKIIMKAEMRTLELGNYAYAIKSMVSEPFENHTVEAYLLQDVFYNRTQYYAEVIQVNLHRLSSRFFVCDPKGRGSDTFKKFEKKTPLVSLKLQESDIAKGKVIVGLQLTTVFDVLTFQIKQAPLLGNFHVNASASEWIKIYDLYSVADNKTTVEPYHWKLMMKELTVPENTVLTGIGFGYDSKNQLDIKLKYTPVLNASTGELDVAASGWMAERHDPQRTKEFSKKVKPSTSCQVDSFPDALNGQCLQMKNLGSGNKGDWIPYVETQEVVPHPMMALSGAGLTHKGHDECGGFLAPVTLTISDYYTRSVGYEREFTLNI
uniref:Hypothetical conserved secreted protein n=1 Tax=Simulium guianense TaxID=445764 RepID=F5GTS9_SIMGU